MNALRRPASLPESRALRGRSLAGLRLAVLAAAACAPVSNAVAGITPRERATDQVDGSVLAIVEEASADAAHGAGQWCGTLDVWRRRVVEEQLPTRGDACPSYSPCDAAALRDASIPGEDTPFRTVRIHFNVFRKADGTAPAATAEDVAEAVEQLNADFAPARLRFQATFRFCNSAFFREVGLNNIDAMKRGFAVNPVGQLNVFVTRIGDGDLLPLRGEGSFTVLGIGTFPWDPAALTATGGIVMNEFVLGGGSKTLTHEVGHCLGLWHTHHGVSEVDACSPCWERADGLAGDITGDRVSDTPPTPRNFRCSPPGGIDACSGGSWGPTATDNFMGYAPDDCMTRFTAQQMGRMHCFLTSRLGTWLVAPPPTPTPAPTPDSFEADDAIPQARGIRVGDSQARSIFPAADIDWVRLDVAARLNIQVETSGPRGGDTFLSIRTAGGQVLAESDDIGPTNYYSRISRAALPAGTYYIRVTSFEGRTVVPSYTLRVTTY